MKVSNLSKTYMLKSGEVKALDDVSFDLPENGTVFILGKSGSGKTTLLNLLSGLDSADEGSVIEVGGKNIVTCSQSERDGYRNSHCGFVFQEYNLIPELDVKENVGLSLELQGNKDNKSAVENALKLVELDGYGNRKITELSGGQKQRVAIARALVKNPEIVFADEPTGALDKSTGESVMKLLKRISEEKLVIVVSHDREFAEKYGDRIIELSDGKLVSDSDGEHTESKQQQKDFKKPKLPLKTAFRIGSSTFRSHPIRCLISVLLSVIAFAFFGASFNMVTADMRSNYLKAVRDSEMQYAIVEKEKVLSQGVINNSLDRFFGADERSWCTTPLTKSDAEQLRGVYNHSACKIFSIKLGEFQRSFGMPYKQIYEETADLKDYYAPSTSGFCNIDEAACEEFGFSVIGRLPQNKSEVAINDNMLNSFIWGGVKDDGVVVNIECAEDIIGKKIYVERPLVYDDGHFGMVIPGKLKTVVGVVNAGCDKNCHDSHAEIEYHPHDKIYISDDLIDAYGLFTVPITKDFEAFADFILDNEENNTRYRFSYVTSLGYYGAAANLVLYRSLFLYLGIIFFVISLVLLINFIVVSVRGQMKQIGILSAMGAEYKNIFAIYGCCVGVICLVVYIIAMMLCAVVTLIINGVVMRESYAGFSVLSFNPLAVLLLLSAVAVAWLLSLVIALHNVKKLTAITLIDRGQIK
ncbi:MAG: ATP-binding cassette domain-containing protein [Clostridia bacterium]|nr:ATP-binding cassette domain-containing protein [Clostridia bacterium]